MRSAYDSLVNYLNYTDLLTVCVARSNLYSAQGCRQLKREGVDGMGWERYPLKSSERR